MWLRLRLDIGWRDLGRGPFYALAPGSQARAQERLESNWALGGQDALACLSVRSGFDLLFQALDLPAGSEVLISALTIPDMPKIVRGHGLVPVPIELAGSDFHVSCEALRSALGPRSKVLVLTHLFGARPDASEVIRLAREHGLLIVEDCAQAWSGRRWRGNPEADVSLFSFGSIKTATALGGALCRVSDPETLRRMRAIQAMQPVQATGRTIARLFKYAGLKLASSTAVAALIAGFARGLGKSLDDLLRNVTRAFPGEELFSQVRRRPACATLRLLDHRLQHYDEARIDRRILHGRRIIRRLGLEQTRPELLESAHTFWLFPLLHEQPEQLMRHLRAHGFDTTQRGSLQVVAPPAGEEAHECCVAEDLLNRTVFLPCYPEMTLEAIDRMCELIVDFDRSRLKH